MIQDSYIEACQQRIQKQGGCFLTYFTKYISTVSKITTWTEF